MDSQLILKESEDHLVSPGSAHNGWGEDADWGVVTADLLPKPFFWALRVLFSPVWFPAKVTWNQGDTDLRFDVHNQYNSIDLKDCILRTQQNAGGSYMTMMRQFRDVPMDCAPGEKAELRIPIWNKEVLKGLKTGQPALCRCSLIDPRGFRPITADILVIPADTDAESADASMPIGPDAVL